MEPLRPGGELLALDFASIAQGMGCAAERADDAVSLEAALARAAARTDQPTVIDLKVDREDLMGGYGAWWDVPQPELGRDGKPAAARQRYLAEKARQVIR